VVSGASDQWTDGRDDSAVDELTETDSSGAQLVDDGREMVSKVAEAVSMVILETVSDSLDDDDDEASTVELEDDDEDEARSAATASSASRTSWLEIHDEMGPVDSDDDEDSAAAAATPALSAAS